MSRVPVMVLAGEFWHGAMGAGLAAGFRAAGWAVHEVDYRHFGARAGSSPILRLASRLTRPFADRAYRETILSACRALRPDIALTIKGTVIDAELLGGIGATGARTVMVYPDVDFVHPGVDTASFEAFDLFVTTKTFHVPHLERRLGPGRVAYVPHGYVDAVHRPLFQDPGASEAVLYAGNRTAPKQRALEELASLDPALKLTILGKRWHGRTADGPLRNAALLGERTGLGLASAIQTAAVTIALHGGPSASMPGWEDRVSTRSFEIPACGGFMLHVDNEEIRGFFEPGREIDTFAGAEELRDKIGFYAARPDVRRRMIEAAHRRCVPAYGYGARAADIDALIRERLGRQLTTARSVTRRQAVPSEKARVAPPASSET